MKKSILLQSFLFLLACTNLYSQAWTSTGTGVQNTTADYTSVYSMIEFNNELYIGGCFTSVNGVLANYIAKFDGTNWSAVGNGLWHTGNSGIIYSGVRAMVVYNGELYVGGRINQSGTTTVYGVAKWDGSAWTPAGGFYSTGDIVASLCVYNNELYAGGMIGGGVNSIAKWNGVAWITMGTGMQHTNGSFGAVRDMKVYNNALYIGGQFDIGNGINSPNLITWNGTNFISIGSGATGSYGITKMGLFENDLIVDGGFTDINGTPFNNIARFDGVSWTGFGSGTGSPGGTSYETQPIQEYNNKMFVGGSLSMAGSTPVNNIAQWDGLSWQTVGTGTNGYVGSLAVFQNELYAAGKFTTAGGISVNNIAKWSEPGAGVTENSTVNSIVVYPNPFSSQATLHTTFPFINATLTIENHLGQIVEQISKIHGHKVVLSRDKLASGLYFVRVTEENKIISVEKVVIADR